MTRPFYRTIYHREGYTLADAFRPQPGWGTRTFTVALANLGDHTEADMLEAAKNLPPEGHRLTSLSIFPVDGDERVIWSTSPDPRFANDQRFAAA